MSIFRNQRRGFVVVLLLWNVALLVQLCDCTEAASPKQPNIIFVLMDDQDLLLDGANYMPKLDKYLRREGMTMANQFVSTPVCCPSRGTYHTGRYIHNIPMTDNSLRGNCSGPAWNNGAETLSVGVQLQRLGYRTGFMGKYLNQYGSNQAGGVEHVPPGWDTWVGLVGNSRYYNYTLSINGQAERHGDDYKHDYLPDVITRKALAFIKKNKNDNEKEKGVRGSSTTTTTTTTKEEETPQKPFFLIVSPPSCHGPHQPAPQYAHAYTNKSFAKAPRTPNYGSHFARDKHWLVRQEAMAWDQDVERREAFGDWEHVRRLETLLSIDDMLEHFVKNLDDMGELENTYIFYTSDHGYHLGQFGLLKDKRFPYETDIKVPGFVRGPGIPPNSTSHAVVVSVDMVPTFIDIAGGHVPEYMDGTSVLSELQDPSLSSGRSFLVEYYGEGDTEGPPHPICASQWKPGMYCEVEGRETLEPGPFEGGLLCSCQDSLNNTYSCIRTMTPEKNTLYCEFQDAESFVEYYNMTTDHWQTHNKADTLTPSEHDKFHSLLSTLKTCRGQACVIQYHTDNVEDSNQILAEQ